jgi:Domain of unknown function (DUF4190)
MPPAGYAPQWGAPPDYAAPRPSTPGIAVAGFICSLAGLFIIPVILSIVGIVLSASGRREARARGASTGLATAGIWIGSVGLALWGLFILLIIIGIAVGGSTSTSGVVQALIP